VARQGRQSGSAGFGLFCPASVLPRDGFFRYKVRARAGAVTRKAISRAAPWRGLRLCHRPHSLQQLRIAGQAAIGFVVFPCQRCRPCPQISPPIP
jgi:hypothetical protein